jgi:DNA repair protein RadC
MGEELMTSTFDPYDSSTRVYREKARQLRADSKRLTLMNQPKHQLYKFSVRRTRVEFAHEGKQLNGPVDVARFLMTYAKDLDRENFFAFHLSAKLDILGFETVAVGGLDSVAVHPREIFRGAILAGAHSIIVAHNHPSGDPRPSDEDMKLAEDLERAGLVLDIPVQDSIIVAEGGAYSIASKGRIDL